MPALDAQQAPERPSDSAVVSVPFAPRDNAEVAPARYFARRADMTIDDFARLEELAYQYGGAPESYLAVEPDGACLMGVDRVGAVCAYDSGRGLHISGGFLCPPEERERLLISICQTARAVKRRLGFHLMREEDLPLLRKHGFTINKFGDEPFLPLGKITWSGSDFEWVRRQTNYCKRHGLVVRELTEDHRDGAEWPALVEQMHAITQLHVRKKVSPRELRMLEGRFFPEHLGRRRMFVVTPATEPTRIEAFLLGNPMNSGREWGLEMYRRRDDAVRGVIPFLMRQTIDILQGEGRSEVSLCVIPGRGMRPMPQDGWLSRVLTGMMYSRFGFIFGGKGQCHFKSRFRPEYRERFLCTAPRVDLLDILGFMKVTQATPFHLGNIWHAFRRGSRNLD